MLNYNNVVGSTTESFRYRQEFYIFNREFLFAEPDSLAQEMLEEPILEPPIQREIIRIGLMF